MRGKSENDTHEMSAYAGRTTFNEASFGLFSFYITLRFRTMVFHLAAFFSVTQSQILSECRYQRLCGLIERNSRRDDLLYALLGASGLLGRLSVVSPALATGGHLRSFHDRTYIEVRAKM